MPHFEISVHLDLTVDEIYLSGTRQMRNEIIYLITDSICSSDRHGRLPDHVLYIILIFKMASVYILCTLCKSM